MTDACFCADDATLWTASTDRTAKLWNVVESRQLWESENQPETVYAVACSQDWTILAASLYDLLSEIKLWDRTSYPRFRASLCGHSLAPCALLFLDDAQTLVSAGIDRSLRFWDVPTGQPRLAVATDPSILECLAVTPDESTIVAGCRNGKIRVFHRATEAEVEEHSR